MEEELVGRRSGINLEFLILEGLEFSTVFDMRLSVDISTWVII